MFVFNKVRWIVIVLFSVLLCGCFEREVQYKAGTYEGASEGYYSRLLVKVVVDEYNLISIEILDNQEPPILAEIVFDVLPPKIIKSNSSDVDIVSGATYTSQALLEAVENALQKARIKDEVTN